jgi:hypothetical protein
MKHREFQRNMKLKQEGEQEHPRKTGAERNGCRVYNAMQKLKKKSGHKCLKDTDDCTISNPMPVAGNLK